MQENVPVTTSILDVKRLFAAKSHLPTDKIKLLYQKRPVGDTKMIKEVFKGDVKQGMELGVMIMGGTAVKGKVEGETAAQAQGTSASAVLQTEEFWTDLKGYLVQRLKDEKKGERVWAVCKEAWQKQI
jgi:hypothetical protein